MRKKLTITKNEFTKKNRKKNQTSIIAATPKDKLRRCKWCVKSMTQKKNW